MVAVAITPNVAIQPGMSEALHHLELEPLIRGKHVAVKLNDTWASAEDTTTVTQPDTLHAVLQFIRGFGPHEGVVTGGVGGRDGRGFPPHRAHGRGDAGWRYLLRP